MENEVKGAIYIAIELIITASVIAVIAVALYFGNTFKAAKENGKASKSFVQEQSVFYKYMNESGEITGSDVVDIMITYSRVYDFAVVYKDNGNIRKRALLTSSNKLEDWSTSNIKELISSGINNNYTMKQILTSDGYSIKAIVFEDTSTGTWADSDLEYVVTNSDFLNIKSNSTYK